MDPSRSHRPANSLAPAPSAPRSPHALALLPLCERFLVGHRVLVVGDASSGLGAAIVERGARSVLVLDDDAARVSEAMITDARRGLSYAVLDDQRSTLRPGSFDLVLVDDLSQWDAPKELVELACKVAPSGVAVFGAPAGSSVGYYDLHDLASGSYAEVRMVGRVPWAGAAFVDFEQAGEGDVMVDTSLRDDAEPEHHYAVAAQREVPLPAYAVVATGAPEAAPVVDETALAEAQAKALALAAAVERSREERRDADARVSELERKLAAQASALAEAQAARDAAVAAAREASSAPAGPPVDDGRVAELEGKLLRAEARARDAERTLASVNVKIGAERDALQRAAAGHKARVAELDQELAQLKARPVVAAPPKDDGRLAALTAELEAVRSLAVEHERRADEARREALELKKRLSAAEAAPRPAPEPAPRPAAKVERVDDAVEAELRDVEARLRDRAREVAELSRALKDRKDLVQELLARIETLEAATAGEDAEALRREVAALRAELERERGARHEGALRGPPGGLLTYPRG